MMDKFGQDPEIDPQVVETRVEDAPECVEGWTCAICLEAVELPDLAIVKGCNHGFCAHCILKWSCVKEVSRCCPTCKAPYSSLFVHRQLDGTLTDYQVEESVVLLTRAKWFQDWLQSREKVTDLYKYSVFRSASAAEDELPAEALARAEWAEDALYQVFEDEYEDEDVEDYYFSSQAGPSRITLGNRRFGANGYMRSGHRCARPSAPCPPKTTGKGRAGASAQSKSTSASSGAAGDGGAQGGASTSKGPGRRARRNARRNAADVLDQD